MKELEEAKLKIQTATEEVKFLRVTALSLKSELEGEEAALATMRQREGITAVTVMALEAGLTKTKLEIEEVQIKEKGENMVELPKALQQAAQEADQANLFAQSTREELQRMKEEAELVKAGASTAQSQLHAALTEVKILEKLALAVIKALHERKASSNMFIESESPRVKLSLRQYLKLSKKAHEAEEQGNARVAAAISEIDAGRENEMKNLEKLAAVKREPSTKRETLRVSKGEGRVCKGRKSRCGAGVEEMESRARAEKESEGLPLGQQILLSEAAQ